MKKIILILIVLLLIVGCAPQEPIVDEVDLLQEELVDEEELVLVEDDLTQTEQVIDDINEQIIQDEELVELEFEELFNYNERVYYYDEGFGVDDVNYKGPLPVMESGEKFTLRIYDTLEGGIDIDVNHKSDDYESTGFLLIGDSYVTKQGIKITLQKVESNKIAYSLEKVSSSEWNNLCADCYSADSIRSDDGMRYANSVEETTIGYKGESYKMQVKVVDREKGQVRLMVNKKELPVLEPGMTYVLDSGVAIKYVLGVAHLLGGADYGYIGFGFIDTHELPLFTLCPDCNDYIIADKVYVRGRNTYDVSRTGKTFKFGTEAYGIGDEFVPIIDGVNARLVTSDVVGLKFDRSEEPAIYCSESADDGADYFVQGTIKVSTVSESNSFFRQDKCVDDNILVEYSCSHVDDRSGGNGKGWTGVMEYKQCPCSDGICV